jgi:hypothetical protein
MASETTFIASMYRLMHSARQFCCLPSSLPLGRVMHLSKHFSCRFCVSSCSANRYGGPCDPRESTAVVGHKQMRGHSCESTQSFCWGEVSVTTAVYNKLNRSMRQF